MTEIEYLQAVDRHARNRVNFSFKNENLDHAAIIMSKILQYSKRIVRIYDTTIDGEIADRHTLFNENLMSFLKAGKVLKIVVKSEDFKESKIYYTLAECSEKYPGQIILKLASDHFKEEVKRIANNKDVNFMVNDVNAFRLEIEDNKRTALCNFNDKKIAADLTSIFDKQFDSCNTKLLPQKQYDYA